MNFFALLVIAIFIDFSMSDEMAIKVFLYDINFDYSLHAMTHSFTQLIDSSMEVFDSIGNYWIN
jgi:hypothetical protein